MIMINYSFTICQKISILAYNSIYQLKLYCINEWIESNLVYFFMCHRRGRTVFHLKHKQNVRLSPSCEIF